MIKEFYMLVSIVLLLTGFVFGHYLTHNDISLQKSLSSVTKITEISSPSLSVAFHEPRVLFYEGTLNPAYPQMERMNKMDLVYEQ